MSSRLDPDGTVTITAAGYSWAEPGHCLAVVGSPAQRVEWSDDWLELLLAERVVTESATRREPDRVASSDLA